MAICVSVPVSTNSLSGIHQRVWQYAAIHLEYDMLRMTGNYLAAARLRSAHSWLRLAGPKGHLP